MSEAYRESDLLYILVVTDKATRARTKCTFAMGKEEAYEVLAHNNEKYPDKEFSLEQVTYE